MVNHSDMAREGARLVDGGGGKSADELVAEIFRMFPTATAADCRRAMQICIEREEMLEEERQEAARSFANKWFAGAPEEVIAASIQLHLRDMKLQPSAAALFPQPDKSKS